MRMIAAALALMFLIALPHFLVELIMSISPWLMLIPLIAFIMWVGYEIRNADRDEVSNL
jgi:hypothetical protein